MVWPTYIYRLTHDSLSLSSLRRILWLLHRWVDPIPVQALKVVHRFIFQRLGEEWTLGVGNQLSCSFATSMVRTGSCGQASAVSLLMSRRQQDFSRSLDSRIRLSICPRFFHEALWIYGQRLILTLFIYTVTLYILRNHLRVGTGEWQRQRHCVRL